MEKLTKNIRVLLEENPDGILESSFWNFYRDKYKKLPDPKQYGFKKRGEILASCSGVSKRTEGRECFVCLKQQDSHSHSEVKRIDFNQLTANVHNVLRENPRGVLQRNFWSLYDEKYEKVNTSDFRMPLANLLQKCPGIELRSSPLGPKVFLKASLLSSKTRGAPEQSGSHRSSDSKNRHKSSPAPVVEEPQPGPSGSKGRVRATSSIQSDPKPSTTESTMSSKPSARKTTKSADFLSLTVSSDSESDSDIQEVTPVDAPGQFSSHRSGRQHSQARPSAIGASHSDIEEVTPIGDFAYGGIQRVGPENILHGPGGHRGLATGSRDSSVERRQHTASPAMIGQPWGGSQFSPFPGRPPFPNFMMGYPVESSVMFQSPRPPQHAMFGSLQQYPHTAAAPRPSSEEDADFPSLSRENQARPKPRHHEPSPDTPRVQSKVTPVNPRNLNRDQLNSLAQECIETLAETREYVSVNRIEKLLLQHCRVSSLRELSCVRRLEDIQAVNEHMRTQCKVNAYIQAFTRVRSLATVYELQENLKDFAPGKQDFEQLKLGPISKQPIVYDYFKLPQTTTNVIEITTADILEHLRNYLTQENLWTDRGINMEKFMTYMADKYNVPSPYELGVRLRSLPLAIQVLKKSQRDCGQAMTSAKQVFAQSAENDVIAAFRNFTTSILDKRGEDCQVRRAYLQMDPAQVVADIYGKCCALIDTISNIHAEQQTKQFRRDLNRKREALGQFVVRVKDDSLLRRLFQFAVSCSTHELEQQLGDYLSSRQEAVKPSTSTEQNRDRPPTAQVIAVVKKYLERCITHGALTLTHLAQIENKLLKEYQFPHFVALAQDNFLDFLLHQQEVKKFVEESGGGLLGLSSTSSIGESTYHPRFQDVLDFIRQCDIKDTVQQELIGHALCTHYQVEEVKALGHGSLGHLLGILEKQPKLHKDSSIVYENALCTKARVGTATASKRQVGLLGHQTKEQALACLQCCPLLENMADWSHWDMVFYPELGNLKDFVQKYGGVHSIQLTVTNDKKVSVETNILALETKPGTLLRITADTSLEQFAESCKQADVSATCGHLVSLVVANKGVANTPLALLGNHIHTALVMLQAEEAKTEVPGAPRGREAGCRAGKFVLECLVKLPLMLGQTLTTKVFLEPLGQLVGSARSKDQLLQCCTTPAKQSHLQALGMLLGVQEWRDSFQQRCEIPECWMTADNLGQAMELEGEVIESEDEEEEEESDAKSTSDLSDLSDMPFELELKEVSDEADDEEEEVKVKQESDTVTAESGRQTKNESSDQDDDNLIVLDDIDPDVVEVSDEEVSVMEVETREQECRVIIEKIRQEEFGVDVVLGEDGQRLMIKQQERLGRSLDRLSKDLYSKDTHFVLELIQNADDNTYPQEMFLEGTQQLPALKFVLEEDRVSVFNNECGFEETNIRALCDVGRSTKGKHKFGYIGQKGIGFKSVFRITDTPEVHSNGFHLHFDVNSGPMGYILPHQEETAKEEDNGGWMTRIVLPYKDDAQAHALRARFEDVHPSLLLFLHRLKVITVHNKVSDETWSMQRRDLADNVIEIAHNRGTDRWLVVKKMLDASHISLKAKSGVEVESTEIALAFPLGQQNLASQVMPDKQPVFAFLPLRSYGFRFIIQGDFDIPSSREDVDRDSLWNQWLRNEFHIFFLEALNIFKSLPDNSPIEAVCSFLQFVPLEDEILDFFRPVASGILKQLKAKACLPAHPDTNKRIVWRLPSQLVLTRDGLVREVVSSEVLQQHLNLNYLHQDVAEHLNTSLVASLGIQTLTTQHLLEITRAHVSTMKAQEGTDPQAAIGTIAKMLVCIFRSMDEFRDNSEILDQLRQLSIIPLVNGDVVALQDHAVFFPLERDNTKPQLKVSVLEQDLNTLHCGMFSCLDSVAVSQVTNLLQQLGVKSWTAKDVINHHIIPVLRADNWQEKSRELLLAYLVYIKTQSDQQPSLVDWDDFKSVAVVLTNHGPRKLTRGPVHFTPAFGNPINLSLNLPGYDWVLLDACYLLGSRAAVDIHTWHEFFSRLGVLDSLAVLEKEEVLTSEKLASSCWSAYKELLPADEGPYHIKDRQCEEFVSLVTANRNLQNSTLLRQQMTILYQILDRDWDTKYSKLTHTQILNDNGVRLRDCQTSFGMLLKTLPWLPTVSVEITDAECGTLTEKVDCRVPGELFAKLPQIQRLLHGHVPYLDVPLGNQSSFPQFLGIRISVTLDMVKEKLVSWCSRTGQTSDTPALFVTSMNHIKAVYGYLQENLPSKQLQDLFHEHPVIFLPNSAPQDNLRDILGHFLQRTEVCWEDPSGLFIKYKSSLRDYHMDDVCKETLCQVYRDLKEFFLGMGRVQEVPQWIEYIDLLTHIANTLSVQRALDDVVRLFSTIGDGMQKKMDSGETVLQASEIEQLIRRLGQEKVFPTKKEGLWVSLGDHPMIGDDKQLERMFQKHGGVHFVDTGEKIGGVQRQRGRGAARNFNQESILLFLKTCGIKSLMECLKVDYNTELYQPSPHLQAYTRAVLPYIQRFLFTNHQDVYEELISRNLAASLKTMQFGQVGKLEVVHSLEHKPDVVEIIYEKCRLKDDHEFYVHKDSLKSFADINHELARHFSNGNGPCQKSLRYFLLELYPLLENNTPLENFEERHDLDTLPEDEPVWEVPQPIIFQPPEPVVMVPDSTIVESQAEPREGSGIMAWPPKSNVAGIVSVGGKKQGEGSQMWPPPAPPEYRDSSDLPEVLLVRKSQHSQDGGDAGIQEDRPAVSRQTSEAFSSSGVITIDGQGDRPQRRDHQEGDRELVTRSASHEDGVGRHLSRQSSAAGSSEKGESHRAPSGPGHGEGSYPPGSSTGAPPPECSTSVESHSEPREVPPEGSADQPRYDSHRGPSGDQAYGHGGGHYAGPPHAEVRMDYEDTGVQGKKRLRNDSDQSNNGSQGQPIPKRPHTWKDHKPVFFDEMSWTAVPTEDLYEDLGSGDALDLPTEEMDASAEQQMIGYWGEKLVNHYLERQQRAEDSDVVEVNWMNKEQESSLPYDFVVRIRGNAGQETKDIFIEVKTTQSGSKGFFEISAKEIAFAQEKGESYKLYRIFSAGDQSAVRLSKIDNLALKMNNKQVRLYMML